MSVTNNIKEVLHHIRCRLYPNRLPNGAGAYIARANNEAVLDIDQICAILKTRVGFTGSYDELLSNIRRILDEVIYQVCDGYAVDMGYYTISPKIGGTFKAGDKSHDRVKNPVSFSFRPNANLRRIIEEHIEIEIEGVARARGLIDKFTDIESGAENSTFTPGNQFSVSGRMIKIAGDNPDTGLYFVPPDAPEEAIKVTRIGENSKRLIIGVSPETRHKLYRIEIRTQYTSSGTIRLKSPRVITSDFVIESTDTARGHGIQFSKNASQKLK